MLFHHFLNLKHCNLFIYFYSSGFCFFLSSQKEMIKMSGQRIINIYIFFCLQNFGSCFQNSSSPCSCQTILLKGCVTGASVWTLSSALRSWRRGASMSVDVAKGTHFKSCKHLYCCLGMSLN